MEREERNNLETKNIRLMLNVETKNIFDLIFLGVMKINLIIERKGPKIEIYELFYCHSAL